jgi:hypothetical protein
LQGFLRAVLVFPEIGLANALLDLVEFFFGACGVKDSSAGRSRGARGRRTCEAGRRWCWP